MVMGYSWETNIFWKEIFNSNLLPGTVKIRYPDMSYYIGYWSIHWNQTGICYYKDKSVYEGQWVNDKWNGHGKLIFPDQSKFLGFFKDGSPVKSFAKDGLLWVHECERWDLYSDENRILCRLQSFLIWKKLNMQMETFTKEILSNH